MWRQVPGLKTRQSRSHSQTAFGNDLHRQCFRKLSVLADLRFSILNQDQGLSEVLRIHLSRADTVYEYEYGVLVSFQCPLKHLFTYEGQILQAMFPFIRASPCWDWCI